LDLQDTCDVVSPRTIRIEARNIEDSMGIAGIPNKFHQIQKKHEIQVEATKINDSKKLEWRLKQDIATVHSAHQLNSGITNERWRCLRSIFGMHTLLITRKGVMSSNMAGNFSSKMEVWFAGKINI